MMFSLGGKMKYKSWDERVVKTFCEECKDYCGSPYHCDEPCGRYMLAAEMAELLDSFAYVLENIPKNGGDK